MVRVGRALGGGGARGLCQIEFIRVLDEMGIKPAVISGSSIGSLIGAVYAGGLSGDEIKEIALDLGLLTFGRWFDLSILSTSGLLKGKAVMEFLDKQLPLKTFEKLRFPLAIVATDFWNRSQRVFQSGDLLPAIRASISIPGLFEPVEEKGRVLIDGGTVNPLPMSVIRDACDLLIAIDVSGTSVPDRKQVPSMFESVMNTFQILGDAIVRDHIRTCKPEIYIKPELVNVQILDFHRAREIMESVNEDVNRFRRELALCLQKIQSGQMQEKRKKRFIFF